MWTGIWVCETTHQGKQESKFVEECIKVAGQYYYWYDDCMILKVCSWNDKLKFCINTKQIYYLFCKTFCHNLNKSHNNQNYSTVVQFTLKY